MKFKTRLAAVAAFSSVSLFAATSQAALILPNTNTFAVNEPGPVAGTVVATQTVAFTTATFDGTLTSEVFIADASNPLGGLTFSYQITNAVTSAHAITRLAVNGFLGYSTDMSFSTDSGTLAPTLNDRDAGGNVVGFTYIGAPIGSGTIAAGATTYRMVVQTNATDYRSVLGNVIDGSIASVAMYAPVVVPEPTSAVALLAAGLLRRRR